MTIPLDDNVVERVNELGSQTWTGLAHRYTAARRDPRSGEGARRNGGRWNPRGLFPTIYLAQPLAACMGEVERAAAAQNLEPGTLLRVPYTLHDLQLAAVPVLDLTQDGALEHVGLRLEDITDDDWAACQAVGHAAWFLQLAGLVAPSATGTGVVIAAFEARLQPGQLEVLHSIPLTFETYQASRAHP